MANHQSLALLQAVLWCVDIVAFKESVFSLLGLFLRTLVLSVVTSLIYDGLNRLFLIWYPASGNLSLPGVLFFVNTMRRRLLIRLMLFSSLQPSKSLNFLFFLRLSVYWFNWWSIFALSSSISSKSSNCWLRRFPSCSLGSEYGIRGACGKFRRHLGSLGSYSCNLNSSMRYSGQESLLLASYTWGRSSRLGSADSLIFFAISFSLNLITIIV